MAEASGGRIKRSLLESIASMFSVHPGHHRHPISLLCVTCMSPDQCVEAEPTPATMHNSRSEQKANLLKSSCGTPPRIGAGFEPGSTGRVHQASVDAQCSRRERRLPNGAQRLPLRWKTAPISRRHSTIGGRLESAAKDAKEVIRPRAWKRQHEAIFGNAGW